MCLRGLLLAVLCVSALAGCAQTREGPAAPARSQTPAQAAAANPYQPAPYVKLRHPEWAKNAVINFSDRPQAVTFRESLYRGRYTDYFASQPAELDAPTRLELKPWD
jgi:hypothetical protein